jgi:putative membrane protein
MSISRKERAGVLAASLSCLLAGYALAQQFTPGQPGATTQPRQGEQPATGASADVDRYLASCWQAKNQAEIEISQLAERQAQNPQVKQFAQKMVQAHSELSRRLQPLAAGQGTTAGATAAAGTNPAISQLIEIDRQIAEQTTSAMKQKLEEKSGSEFDQCYVAGQVACHTQASAALGVIAQRATGQLKQLASQTKQTVDQHLREVEQLAQQLRQGAGGQQQASTFRDRNLRPAGAQQ